MQGSPQAQVQRRLLRLRAVQGRPVQRRVQQLRLAQWQARGAELQALARALVLVQRRAQGRAQAQEQRRAAQG